jgi:predicted PurR-regulated permease PerM
MEIAIWLIVFFLFVIALMVFLGVPQIAARLSEVVTEMKQSNNLKSEELNLLIKNEDKF